MGQRGFIECPGNWHPPGSFPRDHQKVQDWVHRTWSPHRNPWMTGRYNTESSHHLGPSLAVLQQLAGWNCASWKVHRLRAQHLHFLPLHGGSWYLLTNYDCTYNCTRNHIRADCPASQSRHRIEVEMLIGPCVHGGWTLKTANAQEEQRERSSKRSLPSAASASGRPSPAHRATFWLMANTDFSCWSLCKPLLASSL